MRKKYFDYKRCHLALQKQKRGVGDKATDLVIKNKTIITDIIKIFHCPTISLYKKLSQIGLLLLF